MKNPAQTKKDVVTNVQKDAPLKKAAPVSGAKAVKQNSKTVFKKTPLVIETPFNQSVLIQTLAEQTKLERKQVMAVLDSLKAIMIEHLAKKGPGKFKWPGVLMMNIKEKPAAKARTGINPFTGQEMIFAAKPAQRLVKIRALKILKDAI